MLKKLFLLFLVSVTTTSHTMLIDYSSVPEKYEDRDIKEARPLVLYTIENPMPEPRTKLLEVELQKSLLTHAPKAVRSIVDMWHKVEAARKESYGELPKKWLFVGNWGTGKTDMGKAIAGECGMPYFMYDSPDTSAWNGGVINLTKIFDQAIALKKPCVIIIDEIGAVFSQHHNRRGEASMAMHLHELLQKHKEEPILFIGTGCDLGDELLADRLFNGQIIEFSIPKTDEEREQIILYYMRYFEIEDKDLAKEFSKKTVSFSHRGLKKLVSGAYERYLCLDNPSISRPTREDYLDTFNVINEVESRLNKSKKC